MIIGFGLGQQMTKNTAGHLKHFLSLDFQPLWRGKIINFWLEASMLIGPKLMNISRSQVSSKQKSQTLIVSQENN